MLKIADLLARSGKLSPQLVFCSSREFDLNFHGCADAPYPIYVWHGGAYWAKDQYLRIKTDPSFVTYPAVRSAPWWKTFLHIDTEWTSYLPFAYLKILGRSAISQGVTRCLRDDKLLARATLALTEHDWNSCLSPSAKAQATSLSMWKRHLRIFSVGYSRLELWHERYFSAIRAQREARDGLLRLIEDEMPSLLIMPEESPYFGPLVVDAAHRFDIPCVVVPYTLASNQEMARSHLSQEWNVSDAGIIDLLTRAFPQWTVTISGRIIAIYSPYTLVCELLGAYLLPWRYYGGRADVIAAESEFMVQHYLRWGIQPQKIVQTGSLPDDVMCDGLSHRAQRRGELFTALGIAPVSQIILIAVPPDMFAGLQADWEFRDYESLCRFMIETFVGLNRTSSVTIVNLHPRVDPCAVPWMADLGAYIIDQPIENLVPLCDIFASVVSATIRYAVSCGVPVLNYDAFHYGYEDYRSLPGVCHVSTREEYRDVATALVSDAQYFTSRREAQLEAARSLHRLDGHSGERLLQLFCSRVN